MVRSCWRSGRRSGGRGPGTREQGHGVVELVGEKLLRMCWSGRIGPSSHPVMGLAVPGKLKIQLRRERRALCTVVKRRRRKPRGQYIKQVATAQENWPILFFFISLSVLSSSFIFIHCNFCSKVWRRWNKNTN